MSGPLLLLYRLNHVNLNVFFYILSIPFYFFHLVLLSLIIRSVTAMKITRFCNVLCYPSYISVQLPLAECNNNSIKCDPWTEVYFLSLLLESGFKDPGSLLLPRDLKQISSREMKMFNSCVFSDYWKHLVLMDFDKNRSITNWLNPQKITIPCGTVFIVLQISKHWKNIAQCSITIEKVSNRIDIAVKNLHYETQFLR